MPSAVGRRPLDECHVGVLPGERHAGEVVERAAAVIPQGRGVIVAVGYVEERRRRLPLVCSPAQSTGSLPELAIAFGIARVPHGEQVAVGTLDDGRVVVMGCEERPVRGGRDLDILPWTREVGRLRGWSVDHVLRAALYDALLVERWRRRIDTTRLGEFSEDHSKAQHPVAVLRERSHAVRGAQRVDRRAVTAAPGDAELAACVAHGVDLTLCAVATVPVVTPLGDAAVHVVEPPRVGCRSPDVEWDRGLGHLRLVLVLA